MQYDSEPVHFIKEGDTLDVYNCTWYGHQKIYLYFLSVCMFDLAILLNGLTDFETTCTGR